MAVATGCDVADVLAAPYARTLWTFCHLLQQQKADDLRDRSHALYVAGLMAIAFHEPKKLGDEHRQLMADAGLFLPVETARDNARAFIAEIERADQLGAWKVMGDVA